MGVYRTVLCLGLAALFAASLVMPASAEQRTIELGRGDLQADIDKAADGDVLILAAGDHAGPIRLSRKLTIVGATGATLNGSGKGSVVTISAPDVVIRGLTIRGSGRDPEKMDAGVFVEKTATRALVEGNKIEGNLYGIYLHGAEEIGRASCRERVL